MTFNTSNFNTAEVQAARQQFKQQAEANRLAIKNAPKLAKPPKDKK
jgi:hypothetical protein